MTWAFNNLQSHVNDKNHKEGSEGLKQHKLTIKDLENIKSTKRQKEQANHWKTDLAKTIKQENFGAPYVIKWEKKLVLLIMKMLKIR